jgi:hypothetical protein
MSIMILRHHDPAHALDHDPFRARNRNHLIRIRSMMKIRKRKLIHVNNDPTSS